MTSTSSPSTSRLSDVEKLTADNYGSWRQRVYGLMLRTKLVRGRTQTIPPATAIRDSAESTTRQGTHRQR